MKIARFKYGMASDGKIILEKSDGLSDVLTDKNFQLLRELTEEDNENYLWLPTEQLVALPRITTVKDDDGRPFVQNETVLLPIHDYIQLTNPRQTLARFFNGWEKR